MRNALKPMLLVSLAIASAMSFAEANIVGKWRGTFSITLPSTLTPEQKKMAEGQVAAVKKAVILMTVNKGGTYTAVSKGIPGQKDESETGTWKIKGDQVTFKNAKDPEQTVTLSKDAKTMTMTLPGGAGKLVFTKQ